MSGAESPFAAWFDALEHADVVINVLYTGPTDTCTVDLESAEKATAGMGGQEGTEAAAAALPARSFHCHAVILGAQSGYFKAQLSSNWQACGCAFDTGPKRHVDVHMEPEQLDAMQELLRMMYSQALPPAAAPGEQLLLQCLRLADQFQASSCMELLLTALADIPSKDISSAVLGYVFQASPGVEVSLSYPALLASATTALLRLFGDVPKVIMDEGLLQQFCALPHAAVLAWAKSDELRVQSENCVVFLLAAWVKANQDSTAQQHEELAHQIRVFHLGPAYLHQILPSLNWFKDCSGMQHLPAVQCCITAGAKDGQNDKYACYGLCLPSAWMSPSRHRSLSSQTCSWMLSSSQLKELGSGTGLNMSPLVYINGFLMRIFVQGANAPAAAPGKTLGVYRGVNRIAMERAGLPVPDNIMLPVGPALARVGSSGSQVRKEGSIAVAPCMMSCANSWGTDNFLGGSAPTLLELLAPYLQEGQLHVQATFNGVDTVLQA